MRRRLAALTAGLGVIAGTVAFATTAQAEVVVEYEPTPTEMNFGALVEGGQVFTLPDEQDVLSEVTLHAGAAPGTETRLRIHEWDSQNGMPVGDALFTSDPFVYTDGGWPEPLAFDTGTLLLEPGTEYIALIDAVRFSYRLIESGEPGFHWFNANTNTWIGTGTGLAYRMVFLQTPTVTALDPAEGPAGTEVTITGTGLDDATAVDFGDLPAEFTVLSDTEILAVAPDQDPGTVVQVQVTSDTLLSPTGPASEFTYTEVPAEGGEDPGSEAPVTPIGTDDPSAALPNVGAPVSWATSLIALGLLGVGIALLLARRARS